MIYIGRSIDRHHYTTMTKTLEIDLRSAEGLKLNRKPVKRLNTFCVVRIDEKSRESNPDEAGGSNPTWNYKSEIPINGNVQFIYVQVCYRTRFSGHEKRVGEAKIPTKDFMGRYSPEGHLNFLSYRLRDEWGDKCGIVNVSILVQSDSTSATTTFKSSSSSSAATAAMKDYGACPSLTIDGYGGRVVTGVPVRCVYQRPY